MRRRLVVAVTPLLVLLLLGVLVPTAATIAERHTATLVSDRLADASRFSVLALTALTGGTALEADLARLRAELDEYAALYDTGVWFLDREQHVLHATGPGHPGSPPEAALPRLTGAMAGRLPPLERTVLPWDTAEEIVVTPVGRDSQVVAALVFAVPTDTVRARILRDWALLGGLFALVAALVIGAVGPMTRWILRPVTDLERSAAAVRSGDLGARAAPAGGPPELRHLAAGFNDMVEAVHRTIDRQQRFVADAAHQLRNPIASARLSVENLAPHLSERDPDARATYDDAVDDLDRMSSVVDGMLAATALRDRPAAVATVDGALGRRAAAWSAAARGAGMTFTADLADTATVVCEPTGGLAAVVDELVANACRLSDGRTLTVHGARRPEGGYRLVVADDGRGLDPAERRRATERFWRSPRDQNVPGTGLGLAIVAQVLDDSGGTLDLVPTPGGGLTAVVAVPPAASSPPGGVR
ncbi:HAMP domain-containing sensor histidine kinase [Pseudonocardia sp. ICBG1293]|uniref:sensor histidine kinase n=1 Tax=Pseudonocardia sp. ICBG1293 TaxID=2844382 RepID=UPI001CCAC3BC|nr:HAMP domain-containing sensor histidine kinase [Pseudonocardia sp. ICBG1293]